MSLLCVKVGVYGPAHSLQDKQVHSTSGHLLSEGVVHPAISVQRVPEPDPLPGISFDTRPDPIQF